MVNGSLCGLGRSDARIPCRAPEAFPGGLRSTVNQNPEPEACIPSTHTDLGTPRADRRRTHAGHARDRRPAGHRARRHVDHAGGRVDRPARAEALRDRHAEGVRLVPSVPGRNRRPPRLSRVVHDTRRRRHQGAHREPQAHAASPRRDGALHLRSPARLRHVSGERSLRAAGHGRRARRHRDALRPRRRQPSGTRTKTRATPTSPSIPTMCIVCSRCVRACDEVQGTLRADDSGPRVRFEGLGEPERVVLRLRMRVVRRLRRGVPDRRADREVAHPARPSAAYRDDDVRVLRRRLLVQGGGEGRAGRAHGAQPGRPREPRPRVRQGPVRLRLCHASRPHHDADDPQVDRRSVAAGELGRSDRARGERVPPHSGEVRPRLDRRHHLVALHERGDVPRAEARARGVRQQQRRHVRARLPFADRLRPEEHDRRVGRHAGLRLRHEGRRHHRRRRESDRGPSGVRLAAEAAAAAGRQAHRRRSARDRARADAAHRGRLPPAGPARYQRRALQRDRPRRRDRRAHQGTSTSPSAARSIRTTSGRRSSPRSATRPKRPRRPRA